MNKSSGELRDKVDKTVEAKGYLSAHTIQEISAVLIIMTEMHTL